MILFIFLLIFTHIDIYSKYQTECNTYQTFIQEQAQIWTQNYLHKFNQTDHKEILIDIILLSHQIAQQSCTMMLAKLTAQQELLQLYTPSLTDSWHTNLQAIKNDTSQLFNALRSFDQAQHNIEQIIESFRKIGPKIIQIDPEPTQTLINNLKQALIIWGKQQHNLCDELCALEEEFILASSAIADAKQMFQLLENSTEFKHAYLKQAAGYVTKTNKDLEAVFAHITQIRTASILKVQQFFCCFFKTYYELFYLCLTAEEKKTMQTQALGHSIIPDPDTFFDNFDNLIKA